MSTTGKKKLFSGSKKHKHRSSDSAEVFPVPLEQDEGGRRSPASYGGLESPGLSPRDAECTHSRNSITGRKDLSPLDRPSSIASLSGCYRMSKYNSSTSLNSEVIDTQFLNHEEILQLTKDVRSFSESLTHLRGVFSQKDGEKKETIRVAAHERLRTLLKILRSILDRYEALRSTEIHTASVLLITQVKGLTSQDEERDRLKFVEALDQLALAFSNSVTEYLMGDVEQRLPGAKSFESLTSIGSTPDPATFGNQSVPDSRKASFSTEDLDQLLLKLDAGVDLTLERTKAWSKYAKDVIGYVEKRIHLEMEFARNLAKLATSTRPSLREQSFLPFHSTYLTALEHDVEYATNCEATYTNIQGHKFVEQLVARRVEHDKRRKSIQLAWSNIKKEMHDCLTNLDKSRQLYYTRCQDYERAREAVVKSESESLNTSGSSNTTKLDKKKKVEEECIMKMQESETTYKGCIHEANAKQQELKRVKKELLTQLRELIFQCDQTMKAVTHSYFQLQRSLAAPQPIQFQTLCEQTKEYEPGSQFKEFLKTHLPIMGNQGLQDTSTFEFIPYGTDDQNRKQSTQSFDSLEDDLRIIPTSNTRRNRLSNSHERTDKNRSQRVQAWVVNTGMSDSDSVGSSNKSVDVSPSVSPGTGRRRLNRDVSGGTLSSGDEIEEPSPVTVDPTRLIENLPSAFRNITCSKAAQTHLLRKLRTPSKCRECDSYVYFNGAECEKCGLACHKKCLENLAIQCGGKRLLGKMNVFGVNLEAHLRTTGREVPFLVEKCITEIEERAMEVRGIYRVAGLKGKVEKLCQTFENGAELVDLSETQPHLITSVLKLYFRQLPETLLGFSNFQDFISAAKEFPASKNAVYDEDALVSRFKQVVSKLPDANFRTAKYLMHHLKRVSDNEESNQMSTSNLSIVFAPTLLRPSDDLASLSALMDINHQTRAIEILIKYPQVFGTEETPVEALQSVAGDAVDGPAISPNKSSNNNSLPASQPIMRESSLQAPNQVSGFVLPGSSEDSEDPPFRVPGDVESEGEDGDSSGSESDNTESGGLESDGEAVEEMTSRHASSQSKMIPTLLPAQDTTNSPGSRDSSLPENDMFDGYIPSAFSEEQPKRRRHGLSLHGDKVHKARVKANQRSLSSPHHRSLSPHHQIRTEHEPTFV